MARVSETFSYLESKSEIKKKFFGVGGGGGGEVGGGLE